MPAFCRAALAALVLCAPALVACSSGPESAAPDTPDAKEVKLPSEPVTLNVLDVGGALTFTEPMIEEYKRTHPELVDEINYQQAPSAELVGKLKAQQSADSVDIDLVLSGSDAIGAGLQEDVFLRLLPTYERQLGDVTASYTKAAEQSMALGEDHALVLTTEFEGPVWLANPDKVPNPPTTAEGLLQWAKAHPKRLAYAQPPASGPGRQFLMGLPYMLGDEDPADPARGWDKTWSFLKELDGYTASYPSSTDQLNKAFADGTYDMIVTAGGWDLATRADGAIPLSADLTVPDQPFRWIVASHFIAIPRGLEAERVAVALDLMRFLLQRRQQIGIYEAQDKPLPGPAIEGVTVEDASPETQRAIARIWRPEYDVLEQDPATAPELGAEAQAEMYDRWEREIGG